MAVDGGKVAAAGFHYQYLVTVGFVLDMVERQSAGELLEAIHVERRTADSHDSTESSEFNIVDLELEGHDGHRSSVIQVKSSIDPATTAPMSAPEAVRILTELTSTGEADRYLLLTNRRLTRPAAALAKALEDGDESSLQEFFKNLPESPGQTWHRFHRARIDAAVRDLTQLRLNLRQRIQAVRRRRRVGTGADAAGMMTMYLTAKVFQAAAGEISSRVSREKAEAWLAIPAQEVAHATGWFDWGIPVGSWPPLPVIEREDLLRSISQALDLESPIRTPRATVLSGLSGAGKSALACLFAQTNADLFDVLWWVPCESDESVEEAVRSLARTCEALSWKVPPPADLGDVKRFLAQLPGTWLIVLDNVDEKRVFEALVPPSGSGRVLITTTNAALMPTLPKIDVAGMTTVEALALFRTVHRTAEDHEVIELCSKFENLPLGVAMAAGFLAAAQHSLAGTTREYMDALSLAAADSSMAVPPGYPRTLTAAVRLVVKQLIEGDPNGDVLPLRLAMAASFLAESEMPLHLLFAVATVSPEEHSQSQLGPITRLDERHDIYLDKVITVLRTFSLVERRQIHSASKIDDFVADRLAMNRIVQQIIRSDLNTAGAPYGLAGELERAVFHISLWLQGLIDSELFDEMLLVLPHAVEVEAYATATEFASAPLMTLRGNMAQCFKITGNSNKRHALLTRELDTIEAVRGLIATSEPLERIRAQTLAQIVDADIELGSDLRLITHRLSEMVTSLESFSRMSSDISGLAMMAANGLALVELLRPFGQHDASLETRLQALLAQAPQAKAVVAQQSLLRLQRMIVKGGLEEQVIQEGEGMLNEQDLPLGFKIQVHALVAEAYAYSGKAVEACGQMDLLLALVPSLELYSLDIIGAVQNVGLAAASQMLGGHTHLKDVLRRSVDVSEERMGSLEGYELRVHHLSRALLNASEGHWHSASRDLSRAQDFIGVSPHSVRSDLGWDLITEWVSAMCRPHVTSY